MDRIYRIRKQHHRDRLYLVHPVYPVKFNPGKATSLYLLECNGKVILYVYVFGGN